VHVSSVTVGGDATFNDIEEAFDPGLAVVQHTVTLANPAGTAEDIVVTFSEAVTSAWICVWAVTGSASHIPYSWDVGAATSGAALNMPHITYPAGISHGKSRQYEC
jgi:hypothetical protein